MSRTFARSILALGLAASTVTGSGAAFAATHSAARATPSQPSAAQSRAHSQAALMRAVNGFGHAVIAGSDAAINDYATPALLAQAPAGHLINLLGLQNRPQSASLQNVRLNGHAATATLVFRFGSQTRLSRTSL